MKNDTGRGQKVFYSITERLKRQLRLNLHRLQPQHTLFRKIYERLFLYEFWGTAAFIISSEQDFDKLLQSEFNTTRDKLKWGRVSDANNSVIVDELYRAYSNTKIGKKHKKDHNKEMHLYWKKRSQKIAFEEVEFVCQPVQDDIDIRIIKTEYWQINKADKHKKYDTTYRLELPGVAINEFLDNSIGPEKFKSEDVKKAIALLVKEGILKSCMNFRDEIRYKIADQRLRYMIHRLRDFHYEEFDLLLYKWEDFEEPTENEKERIIWLVGEEESERIFRSAEMKRHRNKVLMKTSKNLEEYHNRYLVERMVPQFMTAAYYKSYLTGQVVPHFKESEFSIYDQFQFYHELEEYIQKRNPTIVKNGKYVRRRSSVLTYT